MTTNPVHRQRGLTVALEEVLNAKESGCAYANCSPTATKMLADMLQRPDPRAPMPPPRELILPPLLFTTALGMFSRFMQEFSGESSAVHELETGDKLNIDADLFKTLSGEWKITKRGRDQWLLYLAELIKQPQEIWKLRLAQTEELYLLGQFQRGKQRLDALAVFSRDLNSDANWDGKTAFVADGDVYLTEKRQQLLKHSAAVLFRDV